MFVGPQLFPSLVLWEEKKMHKWQRLRTNGESLRFCGVWQKEHRNHGVPARGWWNGATESRPMKWKGEEPLLLCFQLEARESILKEFGAASQKSKPRLIKTSAAEFPLLLSAVPNASENISVSAAWNTFDNFIHVCYFSFLLCLYFHLILRRGKIPDVFSSNSPQQIPPAPRNCQTFIRQH